MFCFSGVALGGSSSEMLDLGRDGSSWPWTLLPADLLGLINPAATCRNWAVDTSCRALPGDSNPPFSVWSENPTLPLLCCEVEEAAAARGPSQRAGPAALRHEGLDEGPQTRLVPGLCRADPLRDPDSAHGRDWVLPPRTGLCTVGIRSLHRVLSGWSSLGIRSPWEQPGPTRLDQPVQQCGALPLGLRGHANERQHRPGSHHGYYGPGNLAALWPLSAAHLPQLVQSPALHPDRCGVSVSSWNTCDERDFPREEVILRLNCINKIFAKSEKVRKEWSPSVSVCRTCKLK